MKTGLIIKRIWEDKGLMQKEVSAHLGIGNNNKFENGHLDLSVEELQKLAILLNKTIDDILDYGNVVPKEVTVENKPDFENLHLINQLNKITGTRYSGLLIPCSPNKNFRLFFEQNLATK